MIDHTRHGHSVRRIRGQLRVRLLAAAGALLFLLCSGQAARAAGLSWPTTLQSSTEITAPSGAAANPYVEPADLACWSAGACVGVVNYDLPSDDEATVVPITAGVPGPAQQLLLPSGDHSGYLDAVSCQPSGLCVAVGSYTDAHGDFQALVVAINDGVVGTPVEVTPPSATATNPNAELTSVSCPATGDCFAAGNYVASTTLGQAFEVPISGGNPQTPQEVALPAGGQYFDEAPGPFVSCWASDACVLAGQYEDTHFNAHEFVSAITSVTGPPSPEVDVTLPTSDAHADDSSGDQFGEINALSCASSGACAAVGYYTDTQKGSEPLIVPINGGQPSAAGAVSLPAGAEPESTGHRQALLYGVDCPAAGACVAVGRYTVTSSSSSDVPLVVEISASGAGTAFEPSLPAGAVSEQTGSNADELYSVSCPVAGSCLAAGLYGTASPATNQGVIVPVSGGQVEAGEELPFPTGGQQAYTSPVVACSASESCVLGGSYEATTSNYVEGLVDSLQTPLAVATTSLPAGAIGSAYSQSLAATGAWGTYTWSVSSGNLPAGLSLNAQTGVISGTPTSPGTATFTINASGTGSPAQTASQSLSIVVPPPLVTVTPAGSRLKASAGGQVSVSLACTTGACTGTVTVVYAHKVKLKRHKHKLLRTVIGSAGYSLAAGGSQTLTVHLNAAGRRFLKAAKSHRLSVLLSASVTGGATSRRHTTIVLAKTKTKTKTKTKK